MFIEPHRCHYLWELLGHCRSGWVGGLRLYIASEIAKAPDGASRLRHHPMDSVHFSDAAGLTKASSRRVIEPTALNQPVPAVRLRPRPKILRRRALIEEIEFAVDSPLEGDGFEPLVPLLGRAQLSRHARGGPLPSADSLRIQLSSSMRSAAMKASGWSSMTWCLASGTSTTGARGPIRDDM